MATADSRSSAPAFELLETLRWTPDERLFLLQRHLDRLAASAAYFGFDCQDGELRRALDAAVAGASGPLRVRLLLGRDGAVRVETFPLVPSDAVLRVALASTPIDPADPFLYHKTTNRGALQRRQVSGVDETILWNPDGFVTEALTANLVVEIGGARVTPPISCGLLPGTFRAELIARGELAEALVTVEQLHQSPRFWLINSVRGWRRAAFE